MDPEQIKALIEAIKAQDGAAALQIAEALLVTAAGGNAEPSEPELDPLAASAEPAPEEPTPEEVALSAALVSLTGAAGPAEQVVVLSTLIAEREKHAKQVAALELSSRLELVSELVKLSVEYPSTAFEGDPADRKLVARLSSEPLAELRARVATHKAAKAGKVPNAPPARGSGGDGKSFKTSHGLITLSASEIQTCEESGAKLEAYAENKAIREAARRTKGK
jgi:hypothetical protein